MPRSGVDVLPARIALDTSAYSQLRRGEPQTIDAVSEAEVVYIAATVLGELEAGFRAGSRYIDNKRALEEFVSEPYCEITEIDADVARRYGEVFAALKRAGTPIPVNDIWIAAATLDVGAHLITFDADFSKVQDLPHTLFAAQ
jgi:tRNA(fMet)-specific endonuclease VapC